MKKKLLIMITLVVSISMIGGCSLLKAVSNTGDNETKDTQESESEDESKDSGLLDGIKDAVAGKFELKQESITLEMGTELGDVSEYVIADNYDDITMEVAPPDGVDEDGMEFYYHYYDGDEWRHPTPNVPTYVTFSKGDKALTMNIEWIDTTPPTIEDTEPVDFYFVHLADTSKVKLSYWPWILYNSDGDKIVMTKDNSGISKLSYSEKSFNGIEIVKGRIPFENCVDGTTYPYEIVLRDDAGNEAVCTVDVTVHFDVSPETRQKLIDLGYTNPEIDVEADRVVKAYMENPEKIL